MEEKIVISLGGSLIIPDALDVSFLKSFRELILSYIKEGKKFVIITGGGKLCRRYQDAAKEITAPSNDDLDWIGIASLKLNAELTRVIFGEHAYKEVIPDLHAVLSFEKPVIVGAAYEPGHSSDFDAILGAISVGAKKVINLSNIDYVYDFDPKKNPDAKKFEKISWSDYLKLIPEEWDPGLHAPFDPTASRLAHENSIEVAIMNGANLENLSNYIEGKPFTGTVIS